MKLSTQTRRLSPLGGFYDKNSSLRLNLKSRQFEGGEGGLFSMQDSVMSKQKKRFKVVAYIADPGGRAVNCSQ